MTAPRAIFADYVSGQAGAFFAGDFRDAGVRGRAVARATRSVAPEVAAVLEAQNARFAPSAARDAHCAALRRGAAAVVTGQQCGLFLGPLFTLYKAASAVAAARALATETGRSVVPVFWVQTEDHDLPEIATCAVPRSHDAPLTLRLPASPDDRVSVAHRVLPDEVTAQIAALRAAIGNLPHAEAHLASLERHYRPGAGWSEAFAATLAELFAAEGLVLLDARDPVIARAALPVHRRALVDAPAIAAALVARGQALAAAGYVATVHVRPGAPLAFFHPDGATGPRHRLQPTDGGFAEIGSGRRHEQDVLLRVLETDPLCFSTSALLRPIVQDALLPTAAYVAGPGEVAYFAQLAPVYELFGIRMPLVVPRARLRMMEARTLERCARLGIAPDDVARPTSELLPPTTTTHDLDDAALARALVMPFDAALETIRHRIEDVGPGLDVALAKTRATVASAVAKLGRKVANARLQHDGDRVAEVERVRWALAPAGVPQERYYGVSYYAARYGARRFLERVLAEIVPFDPTPKDVVWAAPVAIAAGAGRA